MAATPTRGQTRKFSGKPAAGGSQRKAGGMRPAVQPGGGKSPLKGGGPKYGGKKPGGPKMQPLKPGGGSKPGGGKVGINPPKIGGGKRPMKGSPAQKPGMAYASGGAKSKLGGK